MPRKGKRVPMILRVAAATLAVLGWVLQVGCSEGMSGVAGAAPALLGVANFAMQASSFDANNLNTPSLQGSALQMGQGITQAGNNLERSRQQRVREAQQQRDTAQKTVSDLEAKNEKLPELLENNQARQANLERRLANDPNLSESDRMLIERDLAKARQQEQDLLKLQQELPGQIEKARAEQQRYDSAMQSAMTGSELTEAQERAAREQEQRSMTESWSSLQQDNSDGAVRTSDWRVKEAAKTETPPKSTVNNSQVPSYWL